VGVDARPQSRYPFQFIHGDALTFLMEHGIDFDVIHASPPCQAYSRATAWRGKRSDHPDMIDDVRELLVKSGKTYIIENVQEARGKMRHPILLCGSMFGLPIRRHRYFEVPMISHLLVPACSHRSTDFSHDHGSKQTEAQYRDAMGCEWMTVVEARQAIPPAYTRWIGQAILRMEESNGRG